MRLKILRGVITFFFAVLIGDLFWMQIINGPQYVQQSKNNRIRLVPEEASRGIIYDRNGEPLVANRIVFDVVAIAQEIKKENEKKIFSKLGSYLGLTPDALEQTFHHNFVSSFSPIMLASDVPRLTAFLVEQGMMGLPGIFVKTRAKRDYLYGPAMAHIIGYVGRMRDDEYPRLKKYGYRMKDVIGRSGLEKTFDHQLRGESGGMQLEVDSKGRIVKVLSFRPPEPGKPLYTTIDIKLQELIRRKVNGNKAGVCVMDASNGQILAMYSSPSFDPNIMIDRKKVEEITRILRDPKSPLLNRNLNAYAPGSIFKIVTSYAALKEKIITPQTTFDCEGSFRLGNSLRSCWLKSGHGIIDVVQALEGSCDVFFWKVGLKTGDKVIAHYAHLFGLGQLTHVELPAERKGVVPDARWKKRVLKLPWYGGDTLNFCIGQGYLLVTPVQALRMVGMVANGGYEIWPHLVKGDTADWPKKKVLSSAILDVIKKGMHLVVSGPTGTAPAARIRGVPIYAKTGTAQVAGHTAHGWFVGFADLKSGRRICFAAFFENGGHGGGAPAETAKAVIKYLNKENYGKQGH